MKVEKELAEASLQIHSLQRDSNWQGHLIDQLKQQVSETANSLEVNQLEII